ncbi:hypothetical protein ACQ9ZG_32590 [Streptomyces araujoniae]|uniref:acyl-CoA-like ligand-binding transcription factor n=1 Tax=Streptomyces sp. ZEA17I TaxID=2202516 RepID=UPI0011B62AE2|nr:hypothetical protein [Streptomyces sp. ZEA17I]
MVDGVRPLLTEGLDAAVEAFRLRPADRSLTDYLALLQRRHALPSPDPAVLDLLRLACTDPALRPVWLQAPDDALPVLTQLLAHRTGSDTQDLHVQVHAAVVNSALRIGAENFSLQPPGRAPRPPLTCLLHSESPRRAFPLLTLRVPLSAEARSSSSSG